MPVNVEQAPKSPMWSPTLRVYPGSQTFQGVSRGSDLVLKQA